MSGGQAPARSAPPHDVWTQPPAPSPAPTTMLQPPSAPRPLPPSSSNPLTSTRTLAHRLLVNSSTAIAEALNDVTANSTVTTSTSAATTNNNHLYNFYGNDSSSDVHHYYPQKQLHNNNHHQQYHGSNGSLIGNATSAENNLNRLLSLDVSTPRGAASTAELSRLKEEFYQSYDPQIGLHTAAVLGGILGWLIVYLLYKTKVKRWVLAVARGKYRGRKQHKKDKEKEQQCEEGFGECSEGLDQDQDSGPDLASSSGKKVPTLIEKGPRFGPRLSQPQHHCPPPPYHSRPHQPPGGTQALSLLQRQKSAAVPPSGGGVGKQHSPMPTIIVESYSSLPENKADAAGHPGGPSSTQNAARSDKEKGKPENKNILRKGGGKGEKIKDKEKEKRKKPRRRKGRHKCPEVRVLDVDQAEVMSMLLPPRARADTAQATARWVQTMPLLMQSRQDVTGLLSRIRSSLLGGQKQQSCPLISAALQYAALPLLGLPNVGLNNSMPHLANNGLGSLKNSRDMLFESDDDPLDQESSRQLLQPLPYMAPPPASRPQSSQSHLGTAMLGLVPESSTDRQTHRQTGGQKQMQRPPIPPRSPPAPSSIPARPPPPRLTISIPNTDQPSPASSPTSLVVPCGHKGLGFSGLVAAGGSSLAFSFSAPTSPVPLPVTPTVTIQNCTARAKSRGVFGAGVWDARRDSQDTGSSGSSLDPLLLWQQHDRDCPSFTRRGAVPSLSPAPPLSPAAPPRSSAHSLSPAAPPRSPAHSLSPTGPPRSPTHSLSPAGPRPSPAPLLSPVAHPLSSAALPRSPAHSLSPAVPPRSPAPLLSPAASPLSPAAPPRSPAHSLSPAVPPRSPAPLLSPAASPLSPAAPPFSPAASPRSPASPLSSTVSALSPVAFPLSLAASPLFPSAAPLAPAAVPLSPLSPVPAPSPALPRSPVPLLSNALPPPAHSQPSLCHQPLPPPPASLSPRALSAHSPVAPPSRSCRSSSLSLSPNAPTLLSRLSPLPPPPHSPSAPLRSPNPSVQPQILPPSCRSSWTVFDDDDVDDNDGCVDGRCNGSRSCQRVEDQGAGGGGGGGGGGGSEDDDCRGGGEAGTGGCSRQCSFRSRASSSSARSPCEEGKADRQRRSSARNNALTFETKL